MSEGNCEFLNLMGNCYGAYMDNGFDDMIVSVHQPVLKMEEHSLWMQGVLDDRSVD